MNRRQFLAGTAALNVPLLGVPRAIAAGADTSFAMNALRVVADRRFRPSVAFASAMAAQGASISETDGDLTSLWFNDLAQHFAADSTPVSGLTTPRTALVMTELARGPGVRVLWRAEHSPLPDGRIQHEFNGGDPQIAIVTDILRTPHLFAGLEETLTSWVLAPRVPGSSRAKI